MKPEEFFKEIGVEPEYFESVCDHCDHPMCMPNTSQEDCDPNKEYPKWCYPVITAEHREKLEELILLKGAEIRKRYMHNNFFYKVQGDMSKHSIGKTRQEALLSLIVKLRNAERLTNGEIQEIFN